MSNSAHSKTDADSDISGAENPFALPKDFKSKLKDCCRKHQDSLKPKVTYLWICVSAKGIGEQAVTGNGARISLQDWLNIVDESASLGANWLVLTVTTNLSQHSEIWEICRWAQETHGMSVGLHLVKDDLNNDEIALIKGLDTSKVRLLVRRESLEKLKPLDEAGLVLWTANPQTEDGSRPHCQGPSKMIYVNGRGELYTCGLVDGLDQYRMGNVLERRLSQVIEDPALPHLVEEKIHRISPGCDGCPSLVANFFDANL